jgi:hypothetical protein
MTKFALVDIEDQFGWQLFFDQSNVHWFKNVLETWSRVCSRSETMVWFSLFLLFALFSSLCRFCYSYHCRVTGLQTSKLMAFTQPMILMQMVGCASIRCAGRAESCRDHTSPQFCTNGSISLPLDVRSLRRQCLRQVCASVGSVTVAGLASGNYVNVLSSSFFPSGAANLQITSMLFS